MNRESPRQIWQKKIGKIHTRIMTHDFAYLNGKYYFSAMHQNGLYSFDVKNKILQYERYFMCEKWDDMNIHGSCATTNDKIVFTPMNGKGIFIYSPNNKALQRIPLDSSKINLDLPSKFFGTLVYKNSTILVPCRSKYLLNLRADTEEVEYHDEWRKGLTTPTNSNGMFVKNAYFIFDGDLYIGLLFDRRLIKVSLETFKAESIVIHTDLPGFVDMFFDEAEKCIWLLSNGSNKLLKYQINTYDVTEYEFTSFRVINNLQYPFLNMTKCGKYIYIMSGQSPISYRFDTQSNISEEIKWDIDNNNDSYHEWGFRHYYTKLLDEKRLLVTNATDQTFQTITSNGISKRFYFYDDLYFYRLRMRANKVVEDDNYRLEDYLLSCKNSIYERGREKGYCCML